MHFFQEYERQIKELLPEKKFSQMIVVLKKFYEFLKLTANVSFLMTEMHFLNLFNSCVSLAGRDEYSGVEKHTNGNQVHGDE